MRKRELFKVEGDKIARLRKHCPKCGEGVFLAEHRNRLSCGACGYTEFKSGGRKTPEKPVKKEELGMEEEKPVEKPEGPAPAPPAEQPVQKQEEKPEEEKAETAEEPPREEKPAEESPQKEEVSKPKKETQPVEEPEAQESKENTQKSEENKQ